MLTTEREYYAEEALFHGFVPRVMGTRFDLLIAGIDSPRADALWERTAALLEHLNRVFDRFDPASEVARVNASAARTPVAVGPELGEALQLCRAYCERTEGLFDITLRDFARVRLDTAAGETLVRFEGEDLSLDFGGFAKGYALKKLEAMLREAGIGSAFVDFGNSSILGIGRHPYGPCWRVSLPDPATGAALAEFDLEDRALSVSGNTATHTEHIVDPRSGLRNASRMMAAVTAADPLDAEVVSTAWMIADEEQKRRIARNFEGLDACTYTLHHGQEQ